VQGITTLFVPGNPIVCKNKHPADDHI